MLYNIFNVTFSPMFYIRIERQIFFKFSTSLVYWSAKLNIKILIPEVKE